MKILGLLILLLSFQGYSQELTLKIINKESEEALIFANICLENIQTKEKSFITSDKNGEAVCFIKGKTLVAVSYVGFDASVDTIYPGKNKTIKLKPKAYQIDETVITAQYSPVKADQSIYKVQVLNINAIEQKAAMNLSELLATELNIKISQDGVLGSKINMQGLSGEHVKILVDGVPLIGRMDGNIDLSQINLNNVDHIEIIEGPMSVVYGSNALAGAINIITKENKLHKFSGQINTYYETAGIYDVSASISGKIKNHIIALSATRNFFDGFTLNSSNRSPDWSPKRQYELNGYYINNIKKNGKLKYSFNYFNELIQDKGNLISPYFETAFDQYFFTNRLTNNLDFSTKIKKDYNLNFLVSSSFFDRIKNTYFKDLTTLKQNLTTNESDHDTSGFIAWILKGSVSHGKSDSKLEWQAGYDINIESGEGKRILNDFQSISDYALFSTFKYQPFKKFSLQPGLRLSYNSKYTAIPVYSINTKFDPIEKLHLRASFARGFRAPSLKELYLFFVDINHNVQGNPDLEAESSYNFNFSSSYSLEKMKNHFTFDLGMFYNSINNIITLAQVKGLLYKYINLDNYRTQGGQFSVTYKLHPRFTITSGYSLTGTTARISSQQTLSEIYYYSDFSSGMNYKNTKYGFGLSVNFKYNGKHPQLYTDDEGNITQGYLGSYNLMDVSVRKSFFEDKLHVSTGVKNLFNYTNVISTGSSGGAHSSSDGMAPVGWGRSYFVNLSFRLSKI